MIRINQLKLKPGCPEEELKRKAQRLLRLRPGELKALIVVRRSLDARRKPELYYSYTVDVEVDGREETILKRVQDHRISIVTPVIYRFPAPGTAPLNGRPIVVGLGPAGLFCGYLLALHGYRPLMIERGACVEERLKDVESFWNGGALKPDSNVQFGEGGAGTFSDGKLNTMVKDREGRGREALKILISFGAPEEILYEAKPHIGTDILARVVRNMRRAILDHGGEIRFHSTMTGLLLEENRVTGVCAGEEILPASLVILAIGHSARDTFEMLYRQGIPMEAKSFAVGLRVEHSQKWLDQVQYGAKEAGRADALPPAVYKVTADAGGRGVYSFCMCPGGYVVNASSEPGKLAVNGMSYSGRDGENANSAVVVTVTPADYGDGRPLTGIAFQRELEERAWRAGGGKVPVERYGDFMKAFGIDGKKANAPAEAGPAEPCIKGGWRYAPVHEILPEELNRALIRGMEQFDRELPGFASEDALLSGVESRTSSPVRILRDETFQSGITGLYPCGEGAGYAGGILSAAMDGMKAAEAVASGYAPFPDLRAEGEDCIGKGYFNNDGTKQNTNER